MDKHGRHDSTVVTPLSPVPSPLRQRGLDAAGAAHLSPGGPGRGVHRVAGRGVEAAHALAAQRVLAARRRRATAGPGPRPRRHGGRGGGAGGGGVAGGVRGVQADLASQGPVGTAQQGRTLTGVWGPGTPWGAGLAAGLRSKQPGERRGLQLITSNYFIQPGERKGLEQVTSLYNLEEVGGYN